MDTKHLRHLMPKNAQDVDAATELLAIGPEGLASVVPEMLRNLKHQQSPVSALYCVFFAEHGERFVGNIITMLSRDTMPEVKRLLLEHVLPSWSRDGVAQCAGMLSMIATDPHSLNNDLLALRLLARHQLADPKWLRDWLAFKQERLSERAHLANEIKGEIQGGSQ